MDRLLGFKRRIRTYGVGLSIIWTAVVGGSLAWSLFTQRRNYEAAAYSEAVAYLNKDRAIHLWTAAQGALYVPLEAGRPDPHLEERVDRDIQASTGQSLTMISHVHMIEEINRRYKELFGVSGNLSSQKAIRSEHAPDEWESEALAAFSQGAKEAKAFETVEGQPFLRLMRPLYVEESCLPCHGDQGYRLGEVRGGLSIFLPLEEERARMTRMNLTIGVTHALLWVVGLVLLRLGSRRLGEEVVRREQFEEALVRSERRLFQSQKMQAIATLAGGIAHDLNNTMTKVLGYTEVLKEQLAENTDQSRLLSNISTSARKASDLAWQLLAYARGGKYQLSSMSLNEHILELLEEQKSRLPAGVEIEKDLESGLWDVNADPTQMRQVLINVLSNAVESMDGQGRLSLSTRNVELEAKIETDSEDMAEGKYVYLAISDTGAGMDKHQLARVFEPFYTTKMLGRGLGLSAVYGIVKNHEGYIRASSQRGKGATFEIYLPANI